MQYKYKDIVTSIIPGLFYTFAVGLFAGTNICLNTDGSIELTSLQPVNTTFNWEFVIFIIPLLCICIGYLIAIVGSCFEEIIKRARICNFYLLPRPTLPGSSGNNMSEEWHSIKDSLSENSKVEGYYIRYSQSRNMFFSGLSVAITIIVVGACKITCCWIVFAIFLLVALFRAYRKNYKRYYQVILAEYLREEWKNKELKEQLKGIYGKPF